jgi:hypothetical protein
MHIFQKGKVENFVVIFDLEKEWPHRLPISMMKPFKAILNSLLRCHGIRIFVIGASRFFVAAWAGLSKLLEEG